ncbi:MAG: hypothetical protein M1817_000631 [Caeruleum heppii]|nr:MAG: hypothetical protein M1817_000631 [Caeruleum heppii]
MAIQEVEDQNIYAAHALPTPVNTPYRTPSRSLSRQSSHHDASSPYPSSSPPPMPPDHFRSDSKDAANNGGISIFDPRRFTPTLHANLVSEILSLRRDLDSKHGAIENLESSLHTARTECETLSATLSTNGKETRSLRRQLQLLEGGTSSALGELARERDEAVDTVSEFKRRLDTSQKKVRSQEENADRLQDLWDKDKQNWDGERRHFEHKVHIVEGRLKAVLEEVAAQHAAARVRDERQENTADSDVEEALKDSGIGHGSDTASIRSLAVKSPRPPSAMSIQGPDSVRISLLTGMNGLAVGDHAGMSLADELDLEAVDEDEEEPEGEEDIKGAFDKLPNGISQLNDGVTTAGGLDKRPFHPSVAEEHPEKAGSAVSEEFDAEERVTGRIATSYVDSGVQFSPPPSPKALSTQPKPDIPEEPLSPGKEYEANQRRKRVSATSFSNRIDSAVPASPVPSASSISVACQTADELTAHEDRPKPPERKPPLPPQIDVVSVETISSTTQTTPPPSPEPTRRAPSPPPSSTVPSIAIHPPSSRPMTPELPLRTLRTRSVGCQVSRRSGFKTRSMSVQTEEIRIDQRRVKLPPNLLPSAVSSNPPTPEGNRRGLPRRGHGRVKRDSAVPPSSPPTMPEQLYANDEGLLRSGKTNNIKRPVRQSSLFAGFDLPSSDEAEDFADDGASEAPFHTALSAPNHRLYSEKESQMAAREGARSKKGKARLSDCGGIDSPDTSPIKTKTSGTTRSPGKSRSTMEARKIGGKAHKAMVLDYTMTSNQKRSASIRKSAMISSGTAAHTHRTGSPIPEGNGEGPVGAKDPPPPFPVPTRSSSRKIPISSSEGARSPTRSGSNSSIYSGRKKRAARAPLAKSDSLRKVRSATALPRTQRHGRPQRSRSPPPISSFEPIPDSPRLPPLPKNEVTSPLQLHHRDPKHRPQPSSNPSNTGDTSVRSSIHQTSVVDAISQTMVGEWMWKYVRRRKSFGVTDSPPQGTDLGRTGEDGTVNITGNGVRHKRWVWLAPYERAVMWSSRQPTSGTALLGKSGRKLIIQSVLDVKDDTPQPKNSPPQALFNRSILILTPARALKFTATSKERHYVWLAALSFLSHSNQAPNVLTVPPSERHPEPEEPAPQPLSGLRRHPIRDSIRVAKGKTRPVISPPLPISNGGHHGSSAVELSAGDHVPVPDAADPPTVPRYSSHGRRRSHTGPKAPPSSFRAFSHQMMPPSTHSFATSASSDLFPTSRGGPVGGGPGGAGFGLTSGHSSISLRTSEAGSIFPPTTNTNFFDAVGTVRMEAFVRKTPPPPLPSAQSHGFDEAEEPPIDGLNGLETVRRYRPLGWGGSRDMFDVGGNGLLRADDPFRGF